MAPGDATCSADKPVTSSVLQSELLKQSTQFTEQLNSAITNQTKSLNDSFVSIFTARLTTVEDKVDTCLFDYTNLKENLAKEIAQIKIDTASEIAKIRSETASEIELLKHDIFAGKMNNVWLLCQDNIREQRFRSKSISLYNFQTISKFNHEVMNDVYLRVFVPIFEIAKGAGDIEEVPSFFALIEYGHKLFCDNP